MLSQNAAARSLFSADLAVQKAKLTGMLATIVGAVDKPEMFGSIVENLGKRHALFGVTEEHYPAVGEALMWSLEKTLGPSLTPDAREAWRELYEVVQLSMRGATDREAGAHAGTGIDPYEPERMRRPQRA
jgi:hemoglobin-like flavoprotein